MDIKRFLIDENASILDALKLLSSFTKEDNVSRLILFVVSKEKVIGSITDGDIRRQLIKEKNLNSKVKDVCNNNFEYLEEPFEYIDFSEFREKDILILPVLNKDKSINRIIDLNQICAELPLDCLLMAGGRGKRLSPLTDEVPKPLLPLAGKPIIEHNINRLIKFGIRKFYISLGYLGEQIENYFGDGSNKGIEIIYLKESSPRGTAGALSLIEQLRHKQILLMNSDLYTNIDFESMYIELNQSNSDMVLASRSYNIDVPYGVFNSNKSLINSFSEKPSFTYNINSGIYILKEHVLNMIPKNTYYDINQLINDLLIKKYKLSHFPIKGYWVDIGTPEEYKNAKGLARLNYK